jgi:hypothetical protein
MPLSSTKYMYPCIIIGMQDRNIAKMNNNSLSKCNKIKYFRLKIINQTYILEEIKKGLNYKIPCYHSYLYIFPLLIF